MLRMRTHETHHPPSSEIDPLAIGSRIAAKRKVERLSQRELARLTGLRPERIARLELGKVKPMLREVVKIAAVLKVELAELAFGPIPPDGNGAEGSPS